MFLRRLAFVTVVVLGSGLGPGGIHAQRVPVNRGEFRSDELLLLDRDGSRAFERGIDIAELRPGEFLAAREGSIARESRVGDRLRWELPIRIIGADSTGERINLRPVVEVAGRGLRPGNDFEGFAGEIYLGIEDADEPTRSRPLGREILILVTGEADSVSPGMVAIDHSNLPFLPVRIAALDPGEFVLLHIRPEFDSEGIDVSIAVVRGELILRASPTSIQGLGLETADLTITAKGVPRPEGLAVTLSSDRGRPEPAIVRLDADGIGVALIRSSGTGSAKVDAENVSLQPGRVTIEFVAPWLFVIASILGGFLGFAPESLPILGESSAPLARRDDDRVSRGYAEEEQRSQGRRRLAQNGK